jgi:uncharacterized protein YkwD
MWLGLGLVGLSIIVIAASIVAPSVVGLSSDESPLAAASDDDRLTEPAVRAALLSKLNEYREAEGRARLNANDKLNSAAQAHASDMATKGYLAHRQPDGDTLQDRYANTGVVCDAGAENVAMTYYQTTVQLDNGSTVYYDSPAALAKGVIRQWINSVDHRENMLTRDHTRVGHGVGITTEDGKMAVYVAQDFC